MQPSWCRTLVVASVIVILSLCAGAAPLPTQPSARGGGRLRAALAAVTAPLLAQSGTLAPLARQTFFDGNGRPLAGGTLATYAAGTTTPLATYSDVSLSTPNANPIVLDSAGRAGAIFLGASSYKFVLKTSAGVTVWTQDNIASVSLSSAVIGFSLKSFFGDSASPITVTSYPSGASYSACHAGTLMFNIDSANLSGSYSLEGMLMSVGGGTVTAALVNVSDGQPDTPLVTLASTSTTGERVLSSTITFATAGSAKNYCIKTKVASGSGYVWAASLVRTAAPWPMWSVTSPYKR